MTDYSDLVQKLRGPIKHPQQLINASYEAAHAIEAQAKRIAELEHQMKFECDTFLWNRKLMSRRIALLEYWMEKLFKYGSSPKARRNELTMATEIPD